MFSQLISVWLAIHHETSLLTNRLAPVNDHTAVELRIVEKTNDERVRRGLAALEIDESLMNSARRHCSWMARSHNLRHTSAAVAENIAMGQQNASEAMRSWMNSSGHRANILNRRWGRIGVAAYVASDGTIYWCQQFLE